MAKIIPFRRPVKRRKVSSSVTPARKDGKAEWKESLGELVKELTRSNIDWEKLVENSSIAEIYEVDERLHLRISLPEKKKEDLRLSLSPNLIRVRVVEEEKENILHSIPLPYAVVEATATASYEDGYLEVQLEKKDEEVSEEHLVKIT